MKKSKIFRSLNNRGLRISPQRKSSINTNDKFNSMVTKNQSLLEKYWSEHCLFDEFDYSLRFTLSEDCRETCPDFINLISDPDEVFKLLLKTNPLQMSSICEALKSDADLESLLLNPKKFIGDSFELEDFFPLSTNQDWVNIVWLSLVNVFLRNHKIFIDDESEYVFELEMPYPHFKF